MSQADIIYDNLVKRIINEGVSDEGMNVRTVWADGTPAHTKSIFGVTIELNNQTEVPINTKKFVAAKTAIKEMMLFWIHQTVKKRDFHEQNCHIWDEWFLEDGTLGKSYAYQFESRPKKEVIKVKIKRKEKPLNKISNIVVGERLEHNKEKESKYIGKVFEAKTYGKYIVLDMNIKKDDKSNPKALIQFLDTNYIREVDSSMVLKQQDICDPYARIYFDIGYLGDVDSVKNISKEHKDNLYRRWYYMLDRCYNPKSDNYKNYGGKGVFVDERWHSFENYLRDIRKIPQYFLAKEDDFKGWSVDKDYYCSNYYGYDSCVWIKDEEKLAYRNSNNPFYLIKPDGSKEIFLSYVDAEKEYGLSNLNKILKGERKHVRNFKIEPITVENNYVYRYKLSKNQVVELLHNIKENPSSRRLMTSFWNYKDVEDKALQECCFQTQWKVENDKLHLILTQRSCDVGLGLCFNQFQYAILQRMIAQVSGLKVGKFIHYIGDCHIYSRHEKPLLEQIERDAFDSPQVWINPDITDFFDFTPDDIKLINYNYHPKIEMEVAI